MSSEPRDSTPFIQALRDIVGPSGLLTGEDSVRIKGGLVRPGKAPPPHILLRPASTEEVSAVLRLCNDAGYQVVPQGGMTGLVEGAEIAAGQVALSLERMSAIEEIDTLSGTLLAQAGVPLQAAQEAAEAAGWMLPLDLGGRGSATLGGNVGTNAGGNRVIRYGMTRAMVMGLEVVLADGTILTSLKKILKDNSGYDLKQLFIGAEGTLGVVTRILLRLTPKPASQETALVALNDFASVTALLNHAKRQLDGTLSAFEVMWNGFYSAVTTPPAPHQPPLPGHFPFYVLIEALGSDPQQDHPRFERAMSAALESGLISDAVVAKSEAERHRLWALRDDVAQLGRYYPLTGFDISLPLEAMEAYLSAVEQRLKADWEQTRLIIFGHLGDGNLHLAVSLRADSSEERQRVEEIVYSELASRNGSISAEHGIGLQKKAYLHHCRSDDEVALMRRIKQALDPRGTLNPGKIFD